MSNCLYCLLVKDEKCLELSMKINSVGGVPSFPDSYRSMQNVKVNEITMRSIRDIKWFVDKYGPREKQAKEYFLLKGLKNDDRYEFIMKLIEYGFVHRPAIRMKSILHRELI